MKFNRIISATLAIGMMFCTFTGCEGGGGSGSDGSKSGGSHSTPEAAIESLYDAFNNKKAEKIIEQVYPSDFLKAMKKYEDGEEYDDLVEGVESSLENLSDRYGSDFKITYEIDSKKKMDDDDLEDYQEDIDDAYEELELKAPKVTGGYVFSLNMEIKGSEKSEEDDAEFEVIQLDGSDWYCLDF